MTRFDGNDDNFDDNFLSIHLHVMITNKEGRSGYELGTLMRFLKPRVFENREGLDVHKRIIFEKIRILAFKLCKFPMNLNKLGYEIGGLMALLTLSLIHAIGRE